MDNIQLKNENGKQKPTFKCNLDRTKHTQKPTNIGIIKNAVGAGMGNFTIAEIGHFIACEGCTLGVAALRGTKESDFVEQSICGLDFDGSITPAEVLQRLKAHNLTANIVYKTFSSTPEKLKFRVLMFIDTPISDPELAKNVNKGLLQLFPEADQSCKNLDRIFFGSNAGTYQPIIETPNDAKLIVELVAKLPLQNKALATKDVILDDMPPCLQKMLTLEEKVNPDVGFHQMVCSCLIPTLREMGTLQDALNDNRLTKFINDFNDTKNFPSPQQRHKKIVDAWQYHDKNPLSFECDVMRNALGGDDDICTNCPAREAKLLKFLEDTYGIFIIETPQKTLSKYALKTHSELLHEPSTKWLVKGLLPAKSLSYIYGQPGCGKSFLTLDLCVHIANGEDFYGHKVPQQVPVVYLILEGQGGFLSRLNAYAKHHKKPLSCNMRFINKSFLMTNTSDIESLLQVLPRNSLIVIDTMNRTAPNADENSTKDMSVLISRAQRIIEQTGGFILFVAHSGKNATNGIRGSSAQLAAADAVILVEKHSQGRRWKLEKSKDDVTGTIHNFELKIVTLGFDEDGEITSCVAVPTNNTHTDSGKLAPSLELGINTLTETLQALDKTEAHLDEWRPFFYAKNTAESAEAKKKAFQRVRQDLVSRHHIYVNNDIYSFYDDIGTRDMTGHWGDI